MATIFQTTFSNAFSGNENVQIIQIMAWHRPSDEPLSEPMIVRCILKVPKFNHDTFGKRAFAVCESLLWNLCYAMKLFVSLYNKPCKPKPITNAYMRHSASMS